MSCDKERALLLRVSVTLPKPESKLLFTLAKPLHKPVCKELIPDLRSLISNP